jgi:hypothetical protein
MPNICFTDTMLKGCKVKFYVIFKHKFNIVQV